MPLPFIYIASLRRTGSTVLGEALTQWPHSFIFREPRLGENRFRITETDAQFLASLGKRGIDINALSARWRNKWRPNFVRSFQKKLMPLMLRHCAQLGVKEIRNEGWTEYVRHFPGKGGAGLRIILTARDPRDIYLSMHDRVAGGTSTWSGAFTPESLFEDLAVEFQHQRAMRQALPDWCMIVRYEDLCTQPELFDRIKRFCESPIPGIGQVGSFNASNPNRLTEHKLHGSQITAQRVSRWRSEPNEALRAQADRFFELMEEYAAYFGYEREPILERSAQHNSVSCQRDS